MSTADPTNSPSLADATAFYNHAKTSGFDKATFAKVQTAATEHLRDPSTREKLNEDIKSLVDILRRIEQSFSVLSGCVVSIDEKRILRDRHGNMALFADKWSTLWDEFKSIIKESSIAANTAHVGIKDFIKDLIPGLQADEISTATRDTLRLYIEKLERFESGGIGTGDRFLRLKQGVDAFSESLKYAVQSGAKVVETQLQETNDMLNKTRAQLAEATKYFSGAWSVLKFGGGASRFPDYAYMVESELLLNTLNSASTIASWGSADSGSRGDALMVAATAGLAALAPSVCVGVLLAGFSASGADSAQFSNAAMTQGLVSTPHWLSSKERSFEIPDIESFSSPPQLAISAANQQDGLVETMGFGLPDFMKSLLKERIAKQEVLYNMCRELAQQANASKNMLVELDELTQEIRSLDSVFNGTVERLGTIQGIWRMLVIDSQRLHWKLSEIATQDDELTFMIMVNNVSATYETLELALDQFCSGVGAHRA
ncbi:hypothetical protein B0H34DRAFT_692002 [Crassisporium funariophilum]|nr:hypothetical protein B0H34DRAFT_692002 [Crassisporium funariophilum]